MRERNAVLLRCAIATVALSIVSVAVLCAAARDTRRTIAVYRPMSPAQNLLASHHAFARFELSAVLP